MILHDDHFRDECGIFGAFGVENAASPTYLGLYALQHRGQESTGICSSDGHNHHLHKAMGLVNDVFTEGQIEAMPGHIAIGHNRYSTSGDSSLRNSQPILVSYHGGHLAVAHNGNIVNAIELRRAMEEEGNIFQTTSDSEIVLHLLARSRAGAHAVLVGEAARQHEALEAGQRGGVAVPAEDLRLHAALLQHAGGFVFAVDPGELDDGHPGPIERFASHDLLVPPA